MFKKQDMKKIVFLISVFCLTVQSINAQIIVSDDTTKCGNYIDVLQAVGADQDSIYADDDYSDLINPLFFGPSIAPYVDSLGVDDFVFSNSGVSISQTIIPVEQN